MWSYRSISAFAHNDYPPHDRAAEEEKARKLAAYSSMAAKKGSAGSETTTTTSITTEKTPGDVCFIVFTSVSWLAIQALYSYTIPLSHTQVHCLIHKSVIRLCKHVLIQSYVCQIIIFFCLKVSCS